MFATRALQRMKHVLQFAILVSTLALLAGCNTFVGERELEQPVVITQMAVDLQQAQNLINAYRSERGLQPVTLNATLSDVSLNMARHIAERDSMDTWAHSAFGLSQRLEKAGYLNVAAAENLAAGQNTVEGVVALWKGSEGHNKNLLNPYATEMGFAAVSRNNGKWRMFWVLTLAKPDDRPR